MTGRKEGIAVPTLRLHLFRKLITCSLLSFCLTDWFCRLCADIIRSFTRLDPDSQHRNILAWRPVVVDVIDGYTNFPQAGFDKYIETFYPLGVDLMGREMSPEIRLRLQSLLRRVGKARLGVEEASPEVVRSVNS